MTLHEVREILRERCDECGSQALWGIRNNISPGYISDVLNERREPGPAFLTALGMRKIVTYVREE